jgi:DNA-binding CsgD family transcriptional regulator
MARTTIIFGICLALLMMLLKWVEYSFFIRDISLEVYLGIVGLICMVLGIFLGRKISREREDAAAHAPLISTSNHAYPAQNPFNLSPREYEVLVKIAEGHSYQEIADQLHVSLSTIKSHASNIFSKMDVQRRTQAVMLAQQRGLLSPPIG